MKQSEYRRDRYAREAALRGISARSYYKLKELNERYGFIRAGQRVLDLGAHPGGWTQYLGEVTKGQIDVTAVDIHEVRAKRKYLGFRFVEMDILGGEIAEIAGDILGAEREGLPFDGVVSDLSPKTTGIRDRDAELSHELAMRAWACAREVLRRGGFFVAKAFEHGEMAGVVRRGKQEFRRFRLVRLKSTRRGSREIYLYGEEYAGREEEEGMAEKSH